METTDKERQFTQFVNETKGTIYTVCYMFSKDEDDVNDLFQETLVNLWKGFNDAVVNGNKRAWCYRVAINTCISADRKRRSSGKTVPLTMNMNLFADNDSDTKQVKMLQQRISRLGIMDRAIVLLWLEDLSYEEIGQIIGISTKNVSVRLYRIKEQLKKMSND